MKMHLYKRFKIEVLTFKYFAQQIWWVGSKIRQRGNVLCIMIKIDVLGMSQGRHYAHVTLGCN